MKGKPFRIPRVATRKMCYVRTRHIVLDTKMLIKRKKDKIVSGFRE